MPVLLLVLVILVWAALVLWYWTAQCSLSAVSRALSGDLGRFFGIVVAGAGLLRLIGPLQ